MARKPRTRELETARIYFVVSQTTKNDLFEIAESKGIRASQYLKILLANAIKKERELNLK
jgi:hypothetical protein